MNHEEKNHMPDHPQRMISSEMTELLPAVRGMLRRCGAGRILITIDGPCASGKTTLSGALAAALGCDVIHTDDFVVPHARKTPERLAIPGGNCDWERLTREVLIPWKSGRTVRYRRYDCREDGLKAPETVTSGELLILEGCYCNLPALRAYADIRLFMEPPEEVRLERLRQRESPGSLENYFTRWIPLENAYFDAYSLPDPGCTIMR